MTLSYVLECQCAAKGRTTSEPFAGRTLARDTAQRDVLDVEVLLEAVVPALAPEAALLEAPERRLRRGRQPVVGADDPVLEALGEPDHASDVAGVVVGGEAVDGVVGPPDRLLLGLEGHEGGHGPERLLLRHQHRVVGVGEDGRGEEVAAGSAGFAVHPLAAEEHPRALLAGVGDVALDLLDRLRLDERADLYPFLQPVAYLHA